jgi:hypothetical protein
MHFDQNKRARSGHKQGRKADMAARVRSGRHGQVRQAGPGQAGGLTRQPRPGQPGPGQPGRQAGGLKSGWSRPGMPADKAGGLTGQVG